MTDHALIAVSTLSTMLGEKAKEKKNENKIANDFR